MINTFLGKVFGTKNEREVKRLQPRVAAINALEPEMQKLSDDELRAKTGNFAPVFRSDWQLDPDDPEADLESPDIDRQKEIESSATQRSRGSRRNS